MRNHSILRAAATGIIAGALSAPGVAADASIVVQSTTSTANSGLYDVLLPKFTETTGIKVNVVAVGTGQAIKNAMNGDGDVLLVHAKPAEEKFVADGYGVERFDLMYNDYVIVGPPADPAGIGGLKDAAAALKKIADAKDVLLLLLGLAGVVVGYYFGRVPADARTAQAQQNADAASARAEQVSSQAEAAADQVDAILDRASEPAAAHARGATAGREAEEASSEDLRRVRDALRGIVAAGRRR